MDASLICSRSVSTRDAAGTECCRRMISWARIDARLRRENASSMIPRTEIWADQDPALLYSLLGQALCRSFEAVFSTRMWALRVGSISPAVDGHHIQGFARRPGRYHGEYYRN